MAARAECETGETRLSVPYRKLAEPERLAVYRAIVAGELEGFKSMRARLAPARLLAKRFKRVASSDVALFARDVARIRVFEVGAGVRWRYAGRVRRRAPSQLVFVRRALSGREDPRRRLLRLSPRPS